MSEGNEHEIYAILLQDKKLEFAFRSESECKNFRTRIAKLKSAQDKILRGVDLLEEEQTLRCEIQTSLNPADPSLGPPYICTLWLESRGQKQKWSFKIIEEAVEVESRDSAATEDSVESKLDATLI